MRSAVIFLMPSIWYATSIDLICTLSFWGVCVGVILGLFGGGYFHLSDFRFTFATKDMPMCNFSYPFAPQLALLGTKPSSGVHISSDEGSISFQESHHTLGNLSFHSRKGSRTFF